MDAAQPLALSSTSAYEKPPTNTTPRKRSSVMRPCSRSDMVTSHGSKPAAWKAAAISRSPLLPSSRSTATLTLSAFSMTAASVLAGVMPHDHDGPTRAARPACSSATVAWLACSRSRWKDVSSHSSRRAGVVPSTHASPPTLTATLSPASVVPSLTSGTSAAAYAASTAATSASSTSTTSPSSSAKSAASWPSAAAGRSTVMPQLPANAISRSAVTRPPSLTSWPDASLPSATSACVASQPRLNICTSSMSGTSSPAWSYTCASAEPPRRRLPAARSTSMSWPRPGSFRSGVTVAVISGHVTYALSTSVPGPFTFSPSGAAAAMDMESLPPSMATPSSIMESQRHLTASTRPPPSPGSFGAHIQLPDALIAVRPSVLAHTRLVSASPRVSRAIAP
mmetsp:Transcript_19636/g.66816  ORF Transcript_19636/g.66816 Transcript_19636/m.66816 type:complete len:395 (+) Transcript_19636:731-1915(+)